MVVLAHHRHRPVFAVLASLLLSLRLPAAVPAELFDPGFLPGDCNYHSLTAASDGQIYFSIGSHETHTSVELFKFTPGADTITRLGDLNTALQLDPTRTLQHGKIHTPLIEWDGYLYFASHTSQYDGNLPQLNPPDGRTPYQGGHFLRLELATGTIEDLGALGIPNEGLISMAVDRAHRTLYGLTWPSALLVSWDLDRQRLVNWGSVQQRGEWGHLPGEWNFVCRSLGLDPDGILYGSTDQGRIWRFDTNDQRPVHYYEQLNLDAVPAVQSESFVMEPAPHFYWRNWRTLEWNPATQSFWGLHGGSAQLFEFTPSRGELRSVRPLVPADTPPQQRHPLRTQLGFILGPHNTLYYLAHAPAPPQAADDPRAPVKTAVHLLTYQIDRDTFTDHGPITAPGDRRVFFTESLIIGPDDHLYSVAWVQTSDPAQMAAIRTARGQTGPTETVSIVYDMQLIRLPTWQSLLPP